MKEKIEKKIIYRFCFIIFVMVFDSDCSFKKEPDDFKLHIVTSKTTCNILGKLNETKEESAVSE